MSQNISHIEQRAIDLLGDGHSQVDVANALGVSESRISQLMGEEQFRAAVVQKRYEKLQADSERYDKLNKAQDRILDKITKIIPVVTKPMELVRMFEVLNKAAQKEAPMTPQTTINQKIVVLNLPTKVIHKYTQNSLGQIIEVDGQAVSTAPNSVLYKSKENEQKSNSVPAIDADEIKQIEHRKERIDNAVNPEGSVICAEDL